jgi:hypothetical protein
VLLVATAGVLLIPPWHYQPLWSLVAKLPAGVAVAVVALYVMAPEWVVRGFTKMLRYGPSG